MDLALVFGVLATAGTGGVLASFMLSDGWRPAWRLRITDIKHILKFGAYLVGQNIAGSLHREADIIIGGIISNPGALVQFSVSRNLALKLATTLINPIVTRVGFPLMACVQHDRVQLRSLFLSMLRMVYSINFPLYIMLVLFSKDFVVLLYGPRWEEAAQYLELLAVWGLIRSAGNPIGSLIVAVGRVRRAFWWNVALLVLTPLFLLVGSQINGLRGMVWAMVTLQVLIIVPMWWWLVYPICDASFKEYIRQPMLPLVISMISGSTAILAAHPFEHALLHLGVGILVFIPIYLALSYQFNRSWFTAMRVLLSSDNGQTGETVDSVSP